MHVGLHESPVEAETGRVPAGVENMFTFFFRSESIVGKNGFMVEPEKQTSLEKESTAKRKRLLVSVPRHLRMPVSKLIHVDQE